MKSTVEQLLEHALSVLKNKSFIPMTLEVPIKVERTKEASHGDFSTNLALMLAKPSGQAPHTVARWLVDALPAQDGLVRVEIAGPGFINFFMQTNGRAQIIETVTRAGDDFGRSTMGAGQKILLEYVSANPTGPLHVGHGRSAAFGASLANLLSIAGFHVSREYYVNDAGRQMNILAV